MRNKVAKQLNKLAKLLELTRAERTKLKRDYKKTKNRSLVELKTRVDRVKNTTELANEP